MYGSVFAIEDFAASVGFAFGTCFANNAYIIFYLTVNCFGLHSTTVSIRPGQCITCEAIHLAN